MTHSTNNIKPITTSIAIAVLQAKIDVIQSETLGLTVEIERMEDAIADMAHETAILKASNDALLKDVVEFNELTTLHIAAIKAGDDIEEQRIRKLLGW